MTFKPAQSRSNSKSKGNRSNKPVSQFSDRRLRSIQQVPDCAREEYVIFGYRWNYSTKECLLSLFEKHNETLNIWTHLLPGIIFFLLIFWNICFREDLTTVAELIAHSESRSFLYSIIDYTPDSIIRAIPLDVLLTKQLPLWPRLFYLFCIGVCSFMSAVFHCFCCKGEQHYHSLRRFDYCGISSVFTGSLTSLICYVGAFEDNYWIYLAMICLLAVFMLGCCLHPKFYSEELRAIRAVSFVLCGFVGVIPYIQLLLKYGFYHEFFFPVQILMWSGASLYIIGVMFYVLRIPERWAPGNFDFIGHSHTIFHLFVVSAMLTHYYGFLAAYKLTSFNQL